MRNPLQRPPEPLTYKSKLWRYLSLAKLISLLSQRQLHFCRVDRLEDHREAMLDPRTVDRHVAALLRSPEILRILDDRTDGDHIGRLQAGSSDMLKRASTFVNCWYHSEAESVAMWKIYSGQGVAIQTTWDRLSKALPDDVGLGPVRHIDYEEGYVDPNLPFYCKDRIYRHENEVRAFVSFPPREYSILSVNRDHPTVRPIDVNIGKLIKKVYVSPNSGNWFREVVEEVLDRYGFGSKDVLPSIADEVPEYRKLYNEARIDLMEQAFPLRPYDLEDDVAEAGAAANPRH
jgi:hypothetical protein